MIKAVAGVVYSKGEILLIKRQNFLKAFPGYDSFPGGKIESGDEKNGIGNSFGLDAELYGGLKRELLEELSLDLDKLENEGQLLDVVCLGAAATPDFNPHRFDTYFFTVELKDIPNFIFDENEVKEGKCKKAKDWINLYEGGNLLVVPPVINLLRILVNDPKNLKQQDFSFKYDSEKEVPHIESIYQVRQLIPKSNTLPPANRTNCFLLGDPGEIQFLVDPSPCDEEELEKLLYTADKIGFQGIFLTHHHPDHLEYAPIIARDRSVPMYMSEDTYFRLTQKRGENFFQGIEVKLRREGEVLTKWLGKELHIYEIPGHDKGHLALAPKSMEWFLAGDLFQGIGTVVIGGDEGDMGDYMKTLEKVIALDPAVVYPSHGIGLGSTHILQMTLKHRKMREAQVKKLQAENKTIDEMLAEIYPGLDSRLIPYAKENIRSHLKKLN